jgi:class 3 adenylate cyclase
MVDGLDMDALANALSMTEIIRLQETLSSTLVRRFEHQLALAFSDVVGSTPYFARFGDEAGRKLQQRHFDLLAEALPKGNGRLVDTAGDGAFVVFPSVEEATQSLVELQHGVGVDNAHRTREHHLAVRIGVHFGPVLTDGVQVSGDAVNFCSRLTSTAEAGEIRLSKEAFLAWSDSTFRARCRMLPPVQLKGLNRMAELAVYDWRDRSTVPDAVRFESGHQVPLPDKDVISFGRLKDLDGVAANDFVLTAESAALTKQISRWHFELRRDADGFVLRSVSESPTAVNGVSVPKGEQVPLRTGDQVRVGDVITLTFVSGPRPEAGDGTVIVANTPQGGSVPSTRGAPKGE